MIADLIEEGSIHRVPGTAKTDVHGVALHRILIGSGRTIGPPADRQFLGVERHPKEYVTAGTTMRATEEELQVAAGARDLERHRRGEITPMIPFVTTEAEVTPARAKGDIVRHGESDEDVPADR